MHCTAEHLLLGIFSSQPVDLRGAIDMGDGSSQLDVLSVVSSSVSCTHSYPSYPSVQLNSTSINSRSEKRDAEHLKPTPTEAQKGKSPEPTLSVSDITRWMVFITSLTSPPIPFTAWKKAWCPLKSQTWAKETLLSPGNLGPAESPNPKTNSA